MPLSAKVKFSGNLKTVLSAVKKLTVEEKHILKLKLFGGDLLAELKVFENSLKKKKQPIRKKDDDIVKIINPFRQRNYISSCKQHSTLNINSAK